MKKIIKKSLPWISLFLLAVGGYYIVFSYGKSLIFSAGLSFEEAKTITDILQSIVQVFAIIIAGMWTYERFIKNREDYPYPKIEQRCEFHSLQNRTTYLNVFITIKNEGKTKLDIDTASIYVRQVSPLLSSLEEKLQNALENESEEDIRRGQVDALFVEQGQFLGLDTLGVREWKGSPGQTIEFEPGQTRELRFDFLLLEDDIEVVEIISYFQYGQTAQWELRTMHSLETHAKILGSQSESKPTYPAH